MNKAQLAEKREQLANERTYSKTALDTVVLHNINTILTPVMKAVSKGVLRKLGSKDKDSKPHGRSESGPLGKTFNTLALTKKPKKTPTGRSSSGPLGRAFNAMTLGKDKKNGKDRN